LWPSVLYEWKGDYDRAVIEAKKTVSTDPLSANAVVEYGRALFFAGSVKEAMAQVERARALDSTAERLNLTSGELFMHEGEYGLAQREFERFARLTNQSSRALCFIAHLAAVSGDRAKARTTLDELRRRRTTGKTTAFDLAIAYAGLKEYDAAFAWLNRAYDEHSIRPIIMDPTFRELRKDPRFDQLLKRMKLKS
jgi:tetratricopeptide (TPR) repeat protein